MSSDHVAVQRDVAMVRGYLGHYKEAVDSCEECLSKERKVFDGDALGRIDTAQATLAYLQALRGDTSASFKTNEEVRLGREKRLGNHHFKTLDTASLKAYLLLSQSKLDEAEAVCQKTLSAMRKQLRQGHPSNLRTLGILVLIYQAQGRLSDAEDSARYLCNMNKEMAGVHHPQTLESMNALAALYTSVGRLSEALAIQLEIVQAATGSEDLRSGLGPAHPATLRYTAELSLIYFQLGEYSESWQLAVQALSVQQKVLPPLAPHENDEDSIMQARLWLPTVVTTISSSPATFGESETQAISESGDSNGKPVTAVQTLYGWASTYGIPHPSIIPTLRCIALLECESQHDLGLAESILATIRNYHEGRENGQDNADSASALFELGRLHRQQGKLEISRMEIEEVIQRRTRLLGRAHPDVLSAKFELYVTESALERWEQADRGHVEIRDARVAILGNDHPDTLKSLLELSEVLLAQGKLGEAEETMKTAIDTQVRLCKNYGERRKVCLESSKIMSRLAWIYAEGGQFELAVTTQLEALNTLRRMIGEENSEKNSLILGCKHDLAVVYQAQGNITEATALYEFVLEKGSHNVHLYISSMSNLASLEFTMGRFKEAGEMQREILEKQRKLSGDDHAQTAVIRFNLALTEKESGHLEGALRLLDDNLRLLEKDTELWNVMETTRRQWVEVSQESAKAGSNPQEALSIPPFKPRAIPITTEEEMTADVKP